MPSRITSLDLGNGGEYYGSCKQVLSQSNGSTLDFKSTSTKVSSSQPCVLHVHRWWPASRLSTICASTKYPCWTYYLCMKNKHLEILAMALASPHSHMYLEHHQKFNVDLTYVSSAISWIHPSSSSLWFNVQSTFLHWAKDERTMGWIYFVQDDLLWGTSNSENVAGCSGASWAQSTLLCLLRGIFIYLIKVLWCPDWESKVDDSNETKAWRYVLVGDQTPLVLEVNTVIATMKDVIEKVLKRKLGIDSPVIMQGSSLLYETSDDLEEDMAAHYASLLNKVPTLLC